MVRILIVDDHGVVRKGLRRILEDEIGPAQFAEAESAHEALEHVWRQDWDLVVLDITLPGRSGLDALREIRQARPRLPVLLMSMHSEDQYGLRGLKAGAAGYLTKEAAPEELAKAARKVLAGGKYLSPSLAENLASQLERDDAKPLHEALSNREFEVLRLIASGKTATEIAENLHLSVKTISTYRSRILEKMRMKNNAELTTYAIRTGLVE